MSNKTFGIGTIGCGLIGQKRAKALGEGGRLVACADKDINRAKSLAATSNASAFEDWKALLKVPEVEIVVIATLHDSLAQISLAAIKAGKHVLVEKPLAISWNQLNNIKAFYDGNSEQDLPLLLTGFNRRFSPYLERIKTGISDRATPLVMNYQINTKYLQKDHWQRGDEGGGRNVGEACHIYDLFTFLCRFPTSECGTKSGNLVFA